MSLSFFPLKHPPQRCVESQLHCYLSSVPPVIANPVLDFLECRFKSQLSWSDGAEKLGRVTSSSWGKHKKKTIVPKETVDFYVLVFGQ